MKTPLPAPRPMQRDGDNHLGPGLTGFFVMMLNVSRQCLRQRVAARGLAPIFKAMNHRIKRVLGAEGDNRVTKCRWSVQAVATKVAVAGHAATGKRNRALKAQTTRFNQMRQVELTARTQQFTAQAATTQEAGGRQQAIKLICGLAADCSEKCLHAEILFGGGCSWLESGR